MFPKMSIGALIFPRPPFAHNVGVAITYQPPTAVSSVPCTPPEQGEAYPVEFHSDAPPLSGPRHSGAGQE
jgi:hypothetical protein